MNGFDFNPTTNPRDSAPVTDLLFALVGWHARAMEIQEDRR